MLLEYIVLFKYLIVCFLISFLLAIISFFFVFQKPNFEKLSIYECGFNPFGDSRVRFEVRFYLVAILFIIFDLEITFLFPWVVVFFELSYFGFLSMLIFLFILTVGFAYEWVKGALIWE